MQLGKFLKSRGPILGLVILLGYGLLIFMIYFTGYHAMPANMDKIPVTVINQDGHTSTSLSKQIKQALPFKTVKTGSNLANAKTQLNQRHTYMIVDIPKGFSADVKANRTTNLNFYINESNQTSLVSGMKSAAATIGTQVNQGVVLQKNTVALAKPQLTRLKTSLQRAQSKQKAQLATAQQQIAAAPASQQKQLNSQLQVKVSKTRAKATKQAKQREQKIVKQSENQAKRVANSVRTKIHRVNQVKSGLNYSLAPFIANLSLYLGTMIGTLLLYGTFAKFAPKIGRFKAFINLEFAMVLLALIGGAIDTWGFLAMMGLSSSKFTGLFVTHALAVFAAYNLNSILVLLLGQMGTAVNIFITMLQVVAGAGMIPLLTMNSFFKGIHSVMPMYYGIVADFNVMYGGAGTNSLWIDLIILTGVIFLINLVVVTFRKQQPMLHFEDLS
ncbi:ABC transporter permease [Secundilactobacillus folii]|uniref:ABC-2 type transporter transmembrane domain-containing protein n=1 Tax=Secundilactobacillus folii TaxID=2678357 RepID=A0A7X2XX76_9LACO|nr:ABC transporter permease [Secundilactobacillus folii]MTV83253.1 hypothetical protein [Secundilactobacillus folii]